MGKGELIKAVLAKLERQDKHIEKLEVELARAKLNRDHMTRDLFGLASGEVITIRSMATFMLKVIEMAK